MNEKQLWQFRLFATALSLIVEVAHLGWEFTHGGVVSHHILNMPDMPAISNWWGLLLLPALTWFLAGHIIRRLNSEKAPLTTTPILRLAGGFLGAFIAAILLSLAFTNGNEDAAFYVLIGMLLIALIVPVYRAEYLLGFVHGMIFTFGVVLPIVVGLIIAAISAFVHLSLRPIILNIWRKLNRA
jgi:hypothetical protein